MQRVPMSEGARLMGLVGYTLSGVGDPDYGDGPVKVSAYIGIDPWVNLSEDFQFFNILSLP